MELIETNFKTYRALQINNGKGVAAAGAGAGAGAGRSADRAGTKMLGAANMGHRKKSKVGLGARTKCIVYALRYGI
jgi:hypothetical protein